MNEHWNKEASSQCALDRELLKDIHTAVCGNKEMGVPGLVATVAQHELEIASLKLTRNNGFILGKASSAIIGLVVSLSFIGCFFAAVYSAMKGK